MTILTVNEVFGLGINEPDLVALKASHEELRGRLMDLLARIHRDGGQFADEYGFQEACEDAHKILVRNATDRYDLRKRVAALEVALQSIVERVGRAAPYDDHTYECETRFDRLCNCIVYRLGYIAHTALAGASPTEPT